MPSPAVFLDRDGTINEEVNYLAHPDQLKLISGAAHALRLLRQAGFKVVVVSNQAGVARGYFTEDAVHEIHERLQQILREQEAGLDAIYYCPHHPIHGVGAYRLECNCRKPKPGMLLTAASDLDLELHRSFVVGDRLSDLQAGQAVGCKMILVRTGYGREEEQRLEPSALRPDFVADDLRQAAEWIVSAPQRLSIEFPTERQPRSR